jgi:PIN domain nuclease of toxin-antitoxin system
MPGPPAEWIPSQRQAHGIRSLTIEEEALEHLARLPALHRDPFDRIIIAQLHRHDLTLLTVDAAVLAYPGLALPSATQQVE